MDKDLKKTLVYCLKWIPLALFIGILSGFIAAFFHHAIEFVTQLRMKYSWIIFMMPLIGILIVFLYQKADLETSNTNTVLESVRQKNRVKKRLAPAILFSTILTHLVGGSAGREGAALQIGASLASSLGKIFKIEKKELAILIMCGMSGVFAGLFGTPLTATIFSIEVISIGVIYYSALLPCLCSSLSAYSIAQLLQGEKMHFNVDSITLNFNNLIPLIILGILLALISILFINCMHYGNHLFSEKIKNPYLRIIVGSILMIIIYLIFDQRYLGAGMNVVHEAFNKGVLPYDFLLKIIATTITINCGFKGGEIVPTIFIGATSGALIASLVGLDPVFGAALGIVGMFCSVVNAPIASIFLTIELFNTTNLIPYVLVISICYVLSGYFSLYHSQKFIYSKTALEYIDKNSL